MTSAVIYARFSCSKQREASIDDQLRVCTEYCDSQHIEVVGSYTDYAMSGRTDERPQFQRMIANAGESDYVVVYMMDRFSRDPYDAPIYKSMLAKKGVTVLSAMERIDQTPDGIIMEKLLEGLAARESMVTSQRTRRGMEGNAQKCLYNGDRVFGYSVDESRHYVVDERQAAYVREAFQRRLRRESCTSIARDFALRGVKTYTGRPCSPSMVVNMLKNEKYAGVYTWGDVRVEGGMPAIVDRETFDAVQGVRGRKQRKSERFEDYALSGKSICASCGHNMVGASAHGRSGKRYNYYICGQRCGMRSFRQDVVEPLIVGAIRDLLMTDEAARIAQIVQKSWSGTDGALARENALERLSEAHRGISNIVRSVEEGMPYAAVRERMEQLQEMERKAQEDYALHEHDAEFDVADFVDFLRFGATLDDAHVLSAFVSQVVMSESAIHVVLNYDIEANTPKALDLEVFAESSNGSPQVPKLEPYIRVIGSAVCVCIPLAA